MLKFAEYIWLDGSQPTHKLRSKTKVVFIKNHLNIKIENFPEWSFDGSSTYQAAGKDSDLILKPVNFVEDPIRGDGNYLVLCEVFNRDGTPHATNTRSILRHILENGGRDAHFWLGFEQEYTLYNGDKPLGWPEEGQPEPQGPYYCSVGADTAYGRDLVEIHAAACLEAGLMLYGINSEVMPAQWEFQIGYRGLEHESADPLTISDHRYLALWLLERLGEDSGISINLRNKPVKGDWNGSGCHTNFSTAAMRDPKQGPEAIKEAISALSSKHVEHIAVYGHGLEERLTGLHETSSMDKFSTGVGPSDRGASIRIPPEVAKNGYGYIEDRRPGANCDAYLVCARLISTICGIEDSLLFKRQ